MSEKEIKKTVNIKIDSVIIEGELTIPENATGFRSKFIQYTYSKQINLL